MALSLWEIATQREIRRFSRNGPIGTAYFSQDGQTIFAAEGDFITFWNIETGNVIRSLAGHSVGITDLIPNRDESKIITISRDSTIRLWDLKYGAEQIRGHFPYLGQDGDLSPDEKTFVVVSGGETLRPDYPGLVLLFDATTGTELRRFGEDGIAHTANAGSVRFSPDGKTILSADWAGEIKLWDATTGQLLHEYPSLGTRIYNVDFTPDGKAFIAATSGEVVMGDVTTGEFTRRYVFGASVTKAIFTNNAQQFAACLADNDFSIVVVDVATGQTTSRMTGHKHVCLALALSPDAKMLVSGHVDGGIYVWDMETGQVIRAFTGNRANVVELLFSPDSQTVFSGTFSGGAARNLSLTLWNVQTGQALRRLMGHTRPVHGLDLAADGKTLLSVSFDGTARLWRIDTHQELMDWTRANRYIPELTCEQRQLYRIEPLCDVETP